jgi:hypothetical protein
LTLESVKQIYLGGLANTITVLQQKADINASVQPASRGHWDCNGLKVCLKFRIWKMIALGRLQEKQIGAGIDLKIAAR